MLRQVTLLTVLLIMAFANICSAVNFVKEWTVTRDVISWDIADSGQYFGLINDDSYEILTSQGTALKQGKNIWQGDWIQVSNDMFIIGNGLNGINRVYTYQGNMISSQKCWSYSYLSPTGKYILFGWGEDHYAICKQDGTFLMDGIYFSNWEPLTYSPSDLYIATPYTGLFKFENDQMIQVLKGNIANATFPANEKYIILALTDSERIQTVWKMYDQNLQEIWTKENLKGTIYGHKSGYVIATDKLLTFCNLQNQTIAERSLPTIIQNIYILKNRDFFLVSTASKFYLFNFAGKNIAQIPHTFTDPIWISPVGDRLYTLHEIMLDKESKYGYGPLTQVTITAYQIKY